MSQIPKVVIHQGPNGIGVAFYQAVQDPTSGELLYVAIAGAPTVDEARVNALRFAAGMRLAVLRAKVE